MRSFKATLKAHFRFSREERRDLIILSLIFGFIFSFDQWGIAGFDAREGFANFILAILLSFISLYAHHAAQRVYALRKGFKATQTMWNAVLWPFKTVPVGPVIGILIVVVTRGAAKLLFGSRTDIEPLHGAHRLGRSKVTCVMDALGKVCLAGVLANALLAGIAFWLWSVGFPGNVLLERLVKINIIMLVMNLLPIPPLDGSRIFFVSRPLYVFSAATLLGVVLLAAFGMLWLWWLALVIGFISWLVFEICCESKWA